MMPACSWCHIVLTGAKTFSAASMSLKFDVNSEFLTCLARVRIPHGASRLEPFLGTNLLEVSVGRGLGLNTRMRASHRHTCQCFLSSEQASQVVRHRFPYLSNGITGPQAQRHTTIKLPALLSRTSRDTNDRRGQCHSSRNRCEIKLSLRQRLTAQGASKRTEHLGGYDTAATAIQYKHKALISVEFKVSPEFSIASQR